MNTLARKFLPLLLSQLLWCVPLNAQDTSLIKNSTAPFSRKVYSYLSFIFPIVTVDPDHVTTDFSKATVIGFPIGVNILYSEHFGFSYEFTPTLRFADGKGKMSNLLFDPGPMFRLLKALPSSRDWPLKHPDDTALHRYLTRSSSVQKS